MRTIRSGSQFLGMCLVFAWLAVVGCDGGDNNAANPAVNAPPATVPTTNDGLNIQSAEPSDDTAVIHPDQRLAVQFNQPLNVSTVNDTTIRVIDPTGAQIPGTITVDVVNNIVLFTPQIHFTANTAYRMEITQGITSATGIALTNNVAFNFRTGPRTTPPAPQIVTPPTNTITVSNKEKIRVQFSEATIDATTCNSDTIRLRSADGAAVPATITFDQSTNTVIVTPQVQLETNTEYHVEVTSGVKSLADVSISNTTDIRVVMTDTEEAPDDEVAPQIVSTMPANNTQNIARDVVIEVRFDQAMDVMTLIAATIQLHTEAGAIVPITLHYDGPTKTLHITPNALLEANAIYRLTLGTGITASTGVPLRQSVLVTFTTAAEVVVPPNIVTTTPSNNAVDVPVNIALRVQFDQVMDTTTLTDATLLLRKADGTAVSTSIAYDATSNTVTITPTARLETNTLYQLTITTNVKNSLGVAIPAEVMVDFTTAAEDLTLPPEVTATSPTEGATSVPIDSHLTVQLNQAMDASTLVDPNLRLSEAESGAAVAADIAYNSNTRLVTITPTAALTTSTRYRLEVTTGVKNSAGVALANPVAVTFTTAEEM